MKRARAFYEGVPGLKLTMEADGGLWVEYDIGNGTYGIGCFDQAWKASLEGTCVAFEVEDFDAEVSRLKSERVMFARECVDTPICRFAVIRDADGNMILIHKRKASS